MNKLNVLAILAFLSIVICQCGKPSNNEVDEIISINEPTQANIGDTVILDSIDRYQCRVINIGDTSWLEGVRDGVAKKGERVRFLRQGGIIVRADVEMVGSDGIVARKLVVDTTGLVMYADSCTRLSDGTLKYHIINYYPNGLVKSTGWAVSRGDDYEKIGAWTHYDPDGSMQ